MTFASRLIVLFLLPFLAACGETKSAGQNPKTPPTVLVLKVSFDQSKTEKVYSGTVQPRISSDQSFRVGGKVLRRLVNVGDKVSVGTPLAELDETDLRLQLTQVEAEVVAAQNTLTQQQAQNARTSKLGKEGWLAQAAVDQQQAATDEAQGRLTRAQKAVELAQNAVAYATLVSDSDGVVTGTAIEPGQVVAVGQPAITIAKSGELEVLVAIPENDVAGLSTSDATMTIWSKLEKSYRLKLRELSPLADSATRTFAARYSILNADDNLKLGMSSEFHLTGGSKTSAFVPLAAIIDQGKGPNVWSVDRATGKITLKPVTVERLGQTMAAVSGGIEDGEYIVALGAQKLDSGLTVRPVETLLR